VPVVVAVMGGAWVIGHRAWSAALAARLKEAGVMVVAVDYRNWPCAQVDDMLDDVGSAMDWVFANIADLGGDPASVAMVGQSAGAHLSASFLLRRCAREVQEQVAQGKDAWSVRSMKGFIGVSGVYDLSALNSEMDKRGLYPFLPHMCADGDLKRYSPTWLLTDAAPQMAALMPQVRLLHGEADCSAPSSQTTCFAKALRAAGIEVAASDVRPGMRHTEPVVEDPLTGGDMQLEYILPCLLGKEEAKRRLESLPPVWPQAPRFLVDMMRPVMPF